MSEATPAVTPTIEIAVMTPMNAKLLLRALGENLSRYEAQYGEIIVPTGLAEQLFKPQKPD